MERPMPWDEQIDVISSDESNSSDADAEVSDGFSTFPSQTLDENTFLDKTYREVSTEGALFRKAEMYQDYMKQIPIPPNRGSLVPFTTWMGLGNSIKRLYGQPLHYLTNILLKQWDQSRFGTKDEHQPMDTIIHPSKAEATIWLVEEVHRSTTSHLHIANLWQSDPLYHASVDPIFPNL